jgi:multicomponent Na+:H+ antiporter subunit B
MAVLYILMYAPDVAITEAAVGACLTTIIPLAVLNLIEKKDIVSKTHFYFFPFFICIALWAVLVMYVPSFMPYGSLENIINQHVSKYYIMRSGQEIGIPSTVASILASYRGFDTLGETLVVLTAGLSIYLIIFNSRKLREVPNLDDVVVKKISQIMLPIILIISFYVQLHGEISPGGGFQAGAILASALSFYIIIYEPSKLLRRCSFKQLKNLAVLGFLIYAITGVVCMYLDGEYLNYSVLKSQSTEGQHLGIFIIEIGVGITVCATLSMIFLLFSSAQRVGSNVIFQIKQYEEQGKKDENK